MTRATHRRTGADMVIWIIRMVLTIAIWAALTVVDVRFWGVPLGIPLTATAMLLIWHRQRGGAQ